MKTTLFLQDRAHLAQPAKPLPRNALAASSLVLYKRGDAALPIDLPLSLTVALSGTGMQAPAGVLMVAIIGAQLLATVQNHLRIHPVVLNVVSVAVSPAMQLALRLAAHTPLKSLGDCMKALLAVPTAAGILNASPQKRKGFQLLSNPDTPA